MLHSKEHQHESSAGSFTSHDRGKVWYGRSKSISERDPRKKSRKQSRCQTCDPFSPATQQSTPWTHHSKCPSRYPCGGYPNRYGA
ncbi:hypothetical protein HZ326_15216 [Fusarium oxysporum f. sp. albedinis]|nr:hypothetical protein HZ326_15216 [Fusarium oxysporum f. sp. albedinis]